MSDNHPEKEQEMAPVFNEANEPTHSITDNHNESSTAALRLNGEDRAENNGIVPVGEDEALIPGGAAAGDDNNDDAKSDRSNESMESDYYYDDDGKMHTFYRPKRRISTHSKRALKNLATNEDGKDDTESVNSGTSTLKANPSLTQLPANLHGIGKEIYKLTTEDLLYISAMVGRKAHREAYSILQYSGSAWYLPNIRKVHEGEPEWELRYEWGLGLIITLGGKRMEIQLLSYVLRACFLVLLWFIFRNAIPQYLSEPAGYIFDPVVTFLVCAVVGGFICRILQIPPLVGCLWIGILWNNIHEVGYLTRGIYKDVRTISGRLGITVVLLRAGFSVNWQTVRPVLKNVAALVIGAFGFESMIHGFFCNYMFDYNDYQWAFLQGCLCSAPSAAVVVPGSLMLQAEGYSKTKGPLPIMLASVGIETVVSVWVVSFILDFQFGTLSVGLSAALGPIQIIGGVVLGVILAGVLHLFVVLMRYEARRLPTGRYADTHLDNVKRNSLIAMLLLSHATVFYGYKENLAGGAAVSVMVLAFSVSNFWMRGNNAEWVDHKKALGVGLSDVWDLFVMPFLFSMTGSKIVASKIFNSTFFPKALACWVVSNAARMLAISLTPFGLGFTWKERIFMTIGYCAKATVQSALASAALDQVTKRIAASPVGITPALLIDQKRATDVQNMAVFYVMWSAPLVAIYVTKMGPRLLKRED